MCLLLLVVRSILQQIQFLLQPLNAKTEGPRLPLDALITKGNILLSVLTSRARREREEGSGLTWRSALTGKAVVYPLLVVYHNKMLREKFQDVVLSWFFTDSSGLHISPQALEGALRVTTERPTPNPAFLLGPRRNSVQYHSLHDACDTLELVRLLRALQMNVPVSISFCRSTPVWMPRPFSMYTKSSVATFPEAPWA